VSRSGRAGGNAGDRHPQGQRRRDDEAWRARTGVTPAWQGVGCGEALRHDAIPFSTMGSAGVSPARQVASEAHRDRAREMALVTCREHIVTRSHERGVSL
jgi:hypothetical protein